MKIRLQLRKPWVWLSAAGVAAAAGGLWQWRSRKRRAEFSTGPAIHNREKHPLETPPEAAGWWADLRRRAGWL